LRQQQISENQKKLKELEEKYKLENDAQAQKIAETEKKLQDALAAGDGNVDELQKDID
jgi:septin family protein